MRLTEVVPVLHMHGDLGEKAWLTDRVPSGAGRPYEPTTDPDVVRAVAERIRIVHHGVPDETTDRARLWLREAERILFLGFSYHDLNLAKLNIPETLRGKQVRGTRLGMGQGPIARVNRLAEAQIVFEHREWSMMNVLNEYDWFYE
jgi:hypothetical protein